MIILGDELHDDFRFDEFLMLGEAEAEAVVNLLAPILDAKRTRARKTTEAEAFSRTVGLVVANALAGGERGVHYSRRLETYSGSSPYRPTWLGARRLLGVIDGLERGGLVWVLPGRWGGCFSKGAQSSFGATPLLIEELTALGIEPSAVQRDRASAPVILLKGEDDRLIRYDPTDERVAKLADELRAYNAFIAAQDISLPGWKGASRSSDLTRIYNGGSWERGGRHFGGWWQGVPSKQRPNILINGQETVELDYGGFFPRALYHLTDQELRGDDPYDIPEVRHLIEGQGLDWKTRGRPAVKKMVNTAISAKSKNAFFTKESIDEINISEELVRKCIPLIIEHHSPIKDRLLKGVYLELMNLELIFARALYAMG